VDALRGYQLNFFAYIEYRHVRTPCDGDPTGLFACNEMVISVLIPLSETAYHR
jgi:hypothetical protein